VMKDWSDLEEKYQDMRLADPKAAQSFKQRMTARFQVSHPPCDALISSIPHPNVHPNSVTQKGEAGKKAE